MENTKTQFPAVYKSALQVEARGAFQRSVEKFRNVVGRTVLAGSVVVGGLAYNETAERPEPGISAYVETESDITDNDDELELVAASLSPYCAKRSRSELVAHRGVTDADGTKRIGGKLYTENSAPAVVKGINMGADSAEFDHWLTVDNESAVYHDTLLGSPDVDPNKGGRVDSHAYYGDLEGAKLPSGAMLPTNAQVVRAIDRRTNQGGLQVELKETRGSTERKFAWISGMVTTALDYKANNPKANVLFTSSSRELLRMVNRASDGAIDTGLINFNNRVIPLRNVPAYIDSINNGPHTRGLTSRYIKLARERRTDEAGGIGIGVRSVNTKTMFLKWFKKGVRRFISDNSGAVNNHC